MTIHSLAQKIPRKFLETVPNNWVNGVKDWHINNATPGLYTLDIEHIPDYLVSLHNNPEVNESIEEAYSVKLCQHKCKTCFNEERRIIQSICI